MHRARRVPDCQPPRAAPRVLLQGTAWTASAKKPAAAKAGGAKKPAAAKAAAAKPAADKKKGK